MQAVKVHAQAAIETLRDQRVLLREEFISVLHPGPDPIEQGEKAFQEMGSFARVVPTMGSVYRNVKSVR